MRYKKKIVAEEDMDRMRIALSVQQRKYSGEPHCDFCGAPHPAFIYAASQTTAGVNIPCWRWASCPECSDLIDEEEFEMLAQRIADRLKMHLGILDVSNTVLLVLAHESLRAFHEFSVKV